MQHINEFEEEINQNVPELGEEDGRTEGSGSWDTEERESDLTPDQDEESILNSEVILAEPGLKQTHEFPEDYEEPQDGVEENPEEEDQKNTPQVGSRRVLSFSDYFKN